MFTEQEEYCESCGELLLPGDWPFCDDGTGKHGHRRPHGGTLLTAIHPTERSVVYRHPKTGEVRYPPRADQAMPEVYARQGYERVELTTHADVKQFERQTGRLHERSHYDPGSPTAEREIERSLEPKGLDKQTKAAAKKRLLQTLTAKA
jgi:hypothetical protein